LLVHQQVHTELL